MVDLDHRIVFILGKIAIKNSILNIQFRLINVFLCLLNTNYSTLLFHMFLLKWLKVKFVIILNLITFLMSTVPNK